MGILQQLLHTTNHSHLPFFSPFSSVSNLFINQQQQAVFQQQKWRRVAGTSIDSGIIRRGGIIRAASASPWETWKPQHSSTAPSLSDIFWPSAGAFIAMGVLGKMDEMLAKKGLTMTIAPLGAVSAVLFATPSSPGARKYNMFIAQLGCAAIGVLALSLFGPCWLARSTALAASMAFMIYTRALHPPAASLPLLFIDGAKLHHLKFWYILFPGVAGCLLLCLIQEVVCYMKDNVKF